MHNVIGAIFGANSSFDRSPILQIPNTYNRKKKYNRKNARSCLSFCSILIIAYAILFACGNDNMNLL